MHSNLRMKIRQEIRNDTILLENNILLCLFQVLPTIINTKMLKYNVLIIFILFKYVQHINNFLKNIKKSTTRLEYTSIIIKILTISNLYIIISLRSVYFANMYIFNFDNILILTVILMYVATFYFEAIFALIVYLICFVIINISHNLMNLQENVQFDLYFALYTSIIYCLGFENIFLKPKKSAYRKIYFVTSLYILQKNVLWLCI